jgi:dUTP pyrophosphatase
MASVLSKSDIQELIGKSPPLVSDFINLDEQLQPNGIDLTLRDVSLFQSSGKLPAGSSQRQLPELTPLVFDGLGYIYLAPGIYSITYNEIINLPRDIMALARPRSSLLRCGVSVETAVWDAGYSGRSQSLLIVYNPQGFQLQRNAKVVQLVFFRLTAATEGYQGNYQGENIA